MTATIVPQLRGARVVLRPQTVADIPSLFALHADPDVMRYWSCPPFASVTQAQAMFERNERGVAAGDCVPWALALAADSSLLVGTCSLFAIDAANRRAMIGYALARAHWGCGYAREALRLALAHAFGALQLNRLEADADPRNRASLRLLESVGFAREGLLRERWRVGDDVQDSAMYGLLARDYAAAAAVKPPA